VPVAIGVKVRNNMAKLSEDEGPSPESRGFVLDQPNSGGIGASDDALDPFQRGAGDARSHPVVSSRGGEKGGKRLHFPPSTRMVTAVEAASDHMPTRSREAKSARRSY
jgi:hypothetical protein